MEIGYIVTLVIAVLLIVALAGFAEHLQKRINRLETDKARAEAQRDGHAARNSELYNELIACRTREHKLFQQLQEAPSAEAYDRLEKEKQLLIDALVAEAQNGADWKACALADKALIVYWKQKADDYLTILDQQWRHY